MIPELRLALLEKAGHKVYSPTLTGLGERSHLMSGLITLDTHITDVVNPTPPGAPTNCPGAMRS